MKTVSVLVVIASAVIARHTANGESTFRQLLEEITKRRAAASVRSAYSRAEQLQIVRAHNEYRSSVVPAARDMLIMKWDDRLAHLAQEWAEQCRSFESGSVHGQPADKERVWGPGWLGQNMYWGSARGLHAVESWYGELPFYDRCARKPRCMPGKVCGHYTQMIWAKTNKVGCGFAKCSHLRIKPLVVCNYAPGGNNGGPPYQLYDASHCGNCPAHFCGLNGRPKMYSPKCKCSCSKLYTGDTCTKINCENATDDERCARSSFVVAGSPECDPANGFFFTMGEPIIPQLCPIGCGYCKGPAVPAAPAGVGRFDCRGQKDDDSCRYYGLTQDAAMCDPQQGYTTMDGQTKIIELCPVSCGVCAGSGVEDVVDCSARQDDVTCPYYGLTPSSDMCDPAQGYTTMDGSTKIIDLCPVTCGLCPGK